MGSDVVRELMGACVGAVVVTGAGVFGTGVGTGVTRVGSAVGSDDGSMEMAAVVGGDAPLQVSDEHTGLHKSAQVIPASWLRQNDSSGAPSLDVQYGTENGQAYPSQHEHW